MKSLRTLKLVGWLSLAAGIINVPLYFYRHWILSGPADVALITGDFCLLCIGYVALSVANVWKS